MSSARRPFRRVGRVLLVVVLVAGALYGAAWLLTPYSGLARAIAWMEAEPSDWQRFPARELQAPEVPFQFAVPRGGATELESVDVDGVTRDLDEFLASTHTTSFIVARDSSLLLEWYGNGSARDSVRTSFSVAKSWLSALVGAAIADGHIGSVDDPITRYVPELEDRDERFREITLRNLITMSSGLRYEESGTPWGDDAQTYYAANMRELAIERTEIVGPPGERWLYNNYNPLLVGLAVERAVGMPVTEYLEQEIWRPLGMEFDGSWSLDSERSGFEKMESGLNARAIDYAKLGRLYLNGGEWEEEQVLPREWVEASTAVDTEGDPAAHYQYFWWVDTHPDAENAFMARGNFGQFIYVAPAQGLVFVRLGDDFGHEDWPSVFRSLADRLPASA